MPQRITRASASAAAAEQVLARVAAGLQAARLRTGLSQQQVVDLLAPQGVETTTAMLQRWESSGLLPLDCAVHLADVYGTTLDSLAGRRAFRQHPPAEDDLPHPSRSPW
jgi:hypothetical protein